jgi:hypothetical protein
MFQLWTKYSTPFVVQEGWVKKKGGDVAVFDTREEAEEKKAEYEKALENRAKSDRPTGAATGFR